MYLLSQTFLPYETVQRSNQCLSIIRIHCFVGWPFQKTTLFFEKSAYGGAKRTVIPSDRWSRYSLHSLHHYQYDFFHFRNDVF